MPRSRADDDFDDEDDDRPRKTSTPPARKLTVQDRTASYGFGGLMLALAVGFAGGFVYVMSGGAYPEKLFHLLAVGAVVCGLMGVGLFVHPLDEQQLHSLRHNPTGGFGQMPGFWKAWMVLIVVGIVAAVVAVAQVTVKAGR